MNRLFKGALAGRITATILASAIMVSSSVPVSATDPTAILATDAHVKTLPPLSSDGENNTSVLAEAPDTTPLSANTTSGESDPALKPALQFESEPAPATSSSTPAATDTGAERASLAEITGGGEPTSADTVKKEPVAADANAQADAVKKDLISPAAPEVTDPQPLASGGSDDAPKELAQSTRRGNTLTDPVYAKLPTTIGTVVTLRDFNKFPSNQIIHNLSFRDTPVKEVIAEIARRGNINIIIDRSAVGHITGDLHDVTLNEAMDTVLKSAGLQYRQLDSATIIIGLPNALFRLGLNRPLMRIFKCNYSSPFDIAQLLWATCFNRGINMDFTNNVRDRQVDVTREAPSSKTAEDQLRSASSPTAGGGSQISKTTTQNLNSTTGSIESESGDESTYPTKADQPRSIRGATRDQLNEGSGFASGSTDPGSQTIRSIVSVVTDYSVDQNNGQAICIPDSKNRQVIICGTQEDINMAEECIRLIDRRPRQVHIQSSLVELDNSGIRQLGAALNLQGVGASTALLGGSGAPLNSFLPGLGSSTPTGTVAGIPPRSLPFGGLTSVTSGTPSNNGFLGALGTALPAVAPSIAGVSALNQSQSAFNFLTLSKRAGGAANIATFPVGANISLNLVLQTNKSKLLANPSVLVNDNTESLITLANEVVHKVTTTVSLGVVSTNVELVQAGIFLNVLPKISDDGFVTMRIRPQVSSPLGAPEEFANGSVVVTLLDIRQVMAEEVRVKDGQTLVIGGLFTEQEAASMSKVPYLAEAPILGALFRNTIKGRNRSELMLLITPKIVEDEPPNSLSNGGGPTL
jgi:type II secretory pathway component GspD/PulD (secretin)